MYIVVQYTLSMAIHCHCINFCGARRQIHGYTAREICIAIDVRDRSTTELKFEWDGKMPTLLPVFPLHKPVSFVPQGLFSQLGEFKRIDSDSWLIR